MLTAVAKKTILTAIRSGSTYCDAAEAAGVCYETFRAWRQHGELDVREGKKSVFASFFVAFKKARAEFVTIGVKRIERASIKTWQAYAWLLERRRPKDFALTNDKIRELMRRNAELDAKLEKVLSLLVPADSLSGPNPPSEA
jgi:hypothetical protein